MKKAIFLFSLLGIFCIPFLVSAISGACSGHLGVNCEAGADWDGSVICNDGWRDSITYYTYIQECKSQSFSLPCETNFYTQTDKDYMVNIYQSSVNKWQSELNICLNEAKNKYDNCFHEAEEYKKLLDAMTSGQWSWAKTRYFRPKE